MKVENVEVLVGGFVLSGMLGLGFLALQAADLGSLRGSDTYALTARFDNIGGLRPRAPVRAAGVTVGRVKTIAFDPRIFQGVVTLDIDRGYRFPADTAAKILSAGLLGDQFVALEPGGEDRNLAAGDVIAQTQSAVVLENLIGQFFSSQAERPAGVAPEAAASAAPSPNVPAPD